MRKENLEKAGITEDEVLDTLEEYYEDCGKQLAKEMHADGVINFCHWGCKQSAGGVFQLREALKAADIPLLVLDGDAMDRRCAGHAGIQNRDDRT